VASIRLNKKQQKGPVRSTVVEATRDRAQMLYMKATRSGSEVELWINSLKRKKRKNKQASPSDDLNGVISSVAARSSNDFVPPDIDMFGQVDSRGKELQEKLLSSYPQFLLTVDDKADGIDEESMIREELLIAIQNKLNELQQQQVNILQEIFNAQQEIFHP
jgi:hypothetical protein